jgi:hypothetical protein
MIHKSLDTGVWNSEEMFELQYYLEVITLEMSVKSMRLMTSLRVYRRKKEKRVITDLWNIIRARG